MPIIVKKNGSRTEFESSKLRGSLMLALRKRPVAAEAIDAAIASIEEKLLTSGRREVDSVYVGELVMQELKRLDKIAYIRFASVYKNFEDLAEFQEAIAEVGQQIPQPVHINGSRNISIREHGRRLKSTLFGILVKGFA
jgi:transcriptional repressor NrdR